MNQRNCIRSTASIEQAMRQINDLPKTRTLICLDEQERVIGMLTDGDIRRGLLDGKTMSEPIDSIMNDNFIHAIENRLNFDALAKLRANMNTILPIISESGELHRVLNLNEYKSYVPIHAMIQAGGEGRRLRPLTEDKPKPLVRIGGKPIIAYVLHNLISHGVRRVTVSVRYKAQMIVDYLGSLDLPGVTVDFIHEEQGKGTMGSLSDLQPDNDLPLLVMNSDLLTQIDFEDLVRTHVERKNDMTIAAQQFETNVPFGVIESDEDRITGVREKPSFHSLINTGIYIINPELRSLVKPDYFDATDLITSTIGSGRRAGAYPFTDFWSDIGTHSELKRADNLVNMSRDYEFSLFDPR